MHSPANSPSISHFSALSCAWLPLLQVGNLHPKPHTYLAEMYNTFSTTKHKPAVAGGTACSWLDSVWLGWPNDDDNDDDTGDDAGWLMAMRLVRKISSPNTEPHLGITFPAFRRIYDVRLRANLCFKDSRLCDGEWLFNFCKYGLVLSVRTFGKALSVCVCLQKRHLQKEFRVEACVFKCVLIGLLKDYHTGAKLIQFGSAWGTEKWWTDWDTVRMWPPVASWWPGAKLIEN